MEGNIFLSPREINWGAGAMESVANVLGKRGLVVRAQGLVDRLERIIKNI